MPINPRVNTVKSVGFNIGRVTEKNLRKAPAPSIRAASSISPLTFCNAARNSSMKVPDVVKTARMMSVVIATEGPEIHCHQLMPRGPSPAQNPSGFRMPKPAKAL